MTVRRLICVCGSSVALGLTSASAQDTTTTNRQNDSLTRSLQTGSAENVNQILEQRQGVWRVDVMLSDDFWGKMGHSNVNSGYITPGQRGLGGDTGTTGQTGAERPTSQTDRTTPPAGQEKQDDPSNPWFKQPEKQGDTTTTTKPQSGQIGQTGQAGLASQPGMKHLSGYADCDMVLGENVLHERIVVPAAGEDLGIPADNANNQDNLQTQPANTGAEGFRGITMISFNEDSKTYDMVMLSNQHQGIKYDSGIFDAQRNRVVFRGSGAKTGMSDWKSPTDQPMRENSWQTDPNRDQTDSTGANRNNQTGQTGNQTGNQANSDPYNLDPTPSTPVTGAHSGMAGHNVIVVLEVVDENTQRVTMYDASASGATTQPGGWDRPATDNTGLKDNTGLNDNRDLDDRLDDNDLDDDLDDVNDDLNDDMNDALDDDTDVGDDFDGRKNQDTRTDPNARTPSTTTRTQPLTTASGEFGKIIYQATYTRADSTMEASIRSMIDREIVVASR